MPRRISEEKAKAFAEALIKHGGNRTQAAVALGYKPGNRARVSALQLVRNPAVLKYLQPMMQAHLQSLTPQAISTLQALLSNKSGYIRLEAAKDILNRNGIGTTHEAPKAQQLVVNINLEPAQAAADAKQTLVLDVTPQISHIENATQEEQWSLDTEISKPLSLDD